MGHLIPMPCGQLVRLHPSSFNFYRRGLCIILLYSHQGTPFWYSTKVFPSDTKVFPLVTKDFPLVTKVFPSVTKLSETETVL